MPPYTAHEHAIGQVVGRIEPPMDRLTKSAERDPEISREFDIMEKEISRLADALAHLIERIDPVLRPSEPTSNDRGRPGLDRPKSPIANHLNLLRGRIGLLADSIAATHTRLDL